MKGKGLSRTHLPVFLIIIFIVTLFALMTEAIIKKSQPGNWDSVNARNRDAADGPEYVEGEVLVKFKRGVDRQGADVAVDGPNVRIKKYYHAISRVRGQVYALVASDNTPTQRLRTDLSALPEVEDVSPNYKVYINQVNPNDPRFNELWGLHNTGQTGGTADMDIDAPEAWQQTTGSSSVIVAVIDTGIDYNHTDLAANMWVNPNEIPDGIDNEGNGFIDDIYGINAISGSGDPMDDNGHGTHCAGTIGAVGNNNTGVAGVNWNVKLMGAKFLGSSGSGYTSDAITCVDYIVDQVTSYGQNVVAINASWGGGGYSQSLKDAIDAAGVVGIVFAAAAGNDYSNNDTYPHYPSSYDCTSIIAVTAINAVGSQFYNYGVQSVDIGAPGISILSTIPCQYTPAPGDLFYDDMTDGPNKWIHGGILDSWAITHKDAGGLENYWHDKNYGNFWSDSPGVSYVYNVDSWLAEKTDIDLSPYIGQPVYLGFDGGFQLDYFMSGDTAAVEISNNGGNSWATLADLTTLFANYGYYYKQHVYTIPEAYKTPSFKFRFHITTDNTAYMPGVKDKGWIIDNVGIGVGSSCGYGTKSGTSMATPHVAGAVALIAPSTSGMTAEGRIARLLESAEPLPSLNGICVSGGLLNLEAALQGSTHITVTSPNGGETLISGYTHTITWSTSSNTENVKIELSTDNGGTWDIITASTPNDGSYDWIVPVTVSRDCLVRISGTGGFPSDESDGVFSVQPSLFTVTSPNGGEFWEIGAVKTITWEGGRGIVDNVKIDYSYNSGASWITVTSSTLNDGSYEWTVPNPQATTCLVRVGGADGQPPDVSDETFQIVYPMTLTITSPNGGETWHPGDHRAITWDCTGPMDYVKIELSTDNGDSWYTIDSWVPDNPDNRTYYWWVHDIQSHHCLLRITGISGYPTDTSDGVFTISPPSLTLTSPNGEEILRVGDSVDITWTSVAIPWDVDLHYSIDNGNTWLEIQKDTPNDGKYKWTVPDTPAEACRVRVWCPGVISDQSDSAFQISYRPTITLTSPNGGETLLCGNIHDITWQSTGDLSHVKLEYISEGRDWKTITPSTPNDGHFTWEVPGTEAHSFKVRISGTNGESWDESDAVFSIIHPPSFTLTSPNGGEQFKTGDYYMVTWTSRGWSGKVKIQFSPDNGATWPWSSPYIANEGTYNWYVNQTPSDQCLLRVADVEGHASDSSNAVFSVLAQPFIQVTSPNGGENWQAGSKQDITWKTSNQINGVVLEYSTDNGSSWTTITQGTSNSLSYQWIVPNLPSSNCLVRVSEIASAVKDTSDHVFSIHTQPHIGVTVPNGGEKWRAGSVQTITWDSGGDIPNVKIQFSSDSGASWRNITKSTANTGGFSWTVPNTATTGCRIRVRDLDGNPSDTSNGDFEIYQPSSINLTSPNGGELYQVGSAQLITWKTGGPVETASLEYSGDDGASWLEIISSTGNTGTYNWTVPDAVSSLCKVRITGYSANSKPVRDISNKVFEITGQPQPFITLTSPNGGESWEADTSQQISWVTGGEINKVDIFYSLDSGTSWTAIAKSIAHDQPYTWTLPYQASQNCLVRVTEAGNDSPMDTSDAAFTMFSPIIKVVSPNGGESMAVGTVHTVTWISEGTVGPVSIDCSTDGGKQWTEIIEGTANDGEFQWTVPAGPSDSCLLRIRESTDDKRPWDVSDGEFSIIVPTGETIVLDKPNGGEILSAGAVYPVTWTASQSISTLDMEISTDNGQSWSSEATSIENNGLYQWTVPSVASDQCLIKLSDPDSQATVQSKTVFSIEISGIIEITSPNGGETLNAGDTHEITWTSSGPAIDNVTIDYSGDGGDSWIDIVSGTENTGSFSWTVPGYSSEHCLVRIREHENDHGPLDISDNEFSIDASAYESVTVKSPNGGETLYAGDTHEITWSTGGNITEVAIHYSADNGTTWTVITESAENTGSFDWTVPPTASTVCLVRIEGNPSGQSPVSDDSDSVFEISAAGASSLTLTAPNGGEVLEMGEVFRISWVTGGVIDGVDLEYSTDSGENWEIIGEGIANEDYYDWTTPQLEKPHRNCLVRIRGNDNDDSPSDVSDRVFAIGGSPALTLTSPNGGEELMMGWLWDITWTISGGLQTVIIEFSPDNGGTWEEIATCDAQDGVYRWDVPIPPGHVPTQCLIRIKGIGDSDDIPMDVSDGTFSLKGASYNCGCHGYAQKRVDSQLIKIPGVELIFTNELGEAKRIVTDADGYYWIHLKPELNYTVTASHPDYMPYSRGPFYVSGLGFQQEDCTLTPKQ